ncbi:MAG: phosphoglucosamine mutase [Planctomycetes bacterium]|nr:phosphoglucosamine mutase [Planctomycetota bacterium]
MSELIISVSGLRGVMGETLTPEIAARFVAAFVADLPPGPIVIGRDGRASGPELAETIAAGLVARGRDVLDAGPAATPTIGVLVRSLKAAGGVQISASHNPPQYNGLKLFSAEGRVITAAAGQRVIERFRATTAAASFAEALGAVKLLDDTTTAHWELIRPCIDLQRIRQRRFKVLLDANHGAGSVMGKRLLNELGCAATIVGGPPDGMFAHPPEPTADNLAGILAQVRASGADIGFCQDPDADRLAVIDSAGRYLGEETTLAICVNHVLRAHRGPIVTNCSTSRISEDLAAKHGVAFSRSAVGEANVVDEMLRSGALLGGEGNGGVIDPRVVLVRDSFIGMALILDAMAVRGLTVAELAAELPQYAMHKDKVTLSREMLPAALAALEKHFAGAKVDRLDGLRLDWPGRWLLIRGSNTEPIVRLMSEAATAAEAERLCREAGVVLVGQAIA